MAEPTPFEALAGQLRQAQSLVADMQRDDALRASAAACSRLGELQAALFLAAEHLTSVTVRSRQQAQRIEELSSLVITLNARGI